MRKFIIEREIIGAGELNAEQLQAISEKSCCILHEMGNRLQWLESFVTADKIYCVYLAEDEAAIREHAQRGEFPVNKISEVTQMLKPNPLRGA